MLTQSHDHQAASSSRADEESALRVLFVTSEIFSLAKTGGLADVCASLPLALARRGADVHMLMPGYSEAFDQIVVPSVVADLGEVLPGAPVRLVHGWTPCGGLPVWLIDCPPLFRRPGSPYQDEHGNDWHDNAFRFAVMSHVAALIGCGRTPLTWRPEIVHAHDWHAGLAPLLLRLAGEQRPRTVFTVHNMSFQGNFPLSEGPWLGLPADVLTPDGIEFYGQLSFLKAGILCADRVTTVSPNYAREIRTPEFGFGMEGLLDSRSADLVGIMNGIDTDIWNPASDPYLEHRYSWSDPSGKVANKANLQLQLGLPVDASAPLVASVSRLTWQKMADVLLEQLPGILQRHPRLQFALLGRGERQLEEGFVRLAQGYPGRVAVDIGYDESRAHRLHAGADILLHGSRFEPCGLAQLYAMRYGTIPIVSRVGGLADSVRDADAADGLEGSTGFVFDQLTGEAFAAAVDRCVGLFETQPETWSKLRTRAMCTDFGWTRSAGEYERIYSELLPGRMAVLAGSGVSQDQEHGQTSMSAMRRRAATRADPHKIVLQHPG